MTVDIFFDETVTDVAVRHSGLRVEVSSFNYISDMSYLAFRNRHGAYGFFRHVTGVIAVDEAQESEHWATRFGMAAKAFDNEDTHDYRPFRRDR